jgi:hypothetical protein
MMSFRVSVVVIDVVPLCWQHLSKYFLLRQPESDEIKESRNGSSAFADIVRAHYCVVQVETLPDLHNRIHIVSYTYGLHATESSCNPHSSAL